MNLGNEFDKALAKHAPFKRYTSFHNAGISFAEFEMTLAEQEKVSKIIRHYSEKFTRLMLPKFKAPGRVRSDYGQFLNVEEAVEGEAECYRKVAPKKRAPLRIGINVSRSSSSDELVGMRGGAIVALLALCKSRGQSVRIEVAYGNGIHSMAPVCHVRVNMEGVTLGNITRVCCSKRVLSTMGVKLVEPLSGHWQGVYRFHEFLTQKNFPKEYDFVLDRIDTSCQKTEEDRIMKQLEAFSLV